MKSGVTLCVLIVCLLAISGADAAKKKKKKKNVPPSIDSKVHTAGEPQPHIPFFFCCAMVLSSHNEDTMELKVLAQLK